MKENKVIIRKGGKRKERRKVLQTFASVQRRFVPV